MEIRKITSGFVIQRFNDKGEFLGQEFVAGECVYENAKGEPVEVEPDYQSYDMVQPNQVMIPLDAYDGILADLFSGCDHTRIMDDLLKYKQ